MSRRKKVLITTNPPWIYTGLGESGKFLAQWLQRTGKYDLVYYCSQTSVLDPNHGRQPWKSRGCIPADPQIIQQLNQDPGRARMASYGGLLIDQVVKEEKPDIVWASDDLWSFGKGEFYGAPWWSQIHSFLHVTVDSVPILDQAYEQAKSTPHFYTWAKFAAEEMRKRGKEYSHVKQIYGATNVGQFSPLSTGEKLELRKRFGIDPKAVIFGYTARNQLRKEYPQLLMALKRLKSSRPKANVKLHLHCSWSETAAGWDFQRLMKYLEVDPNDVLCTYVCRQCGGWHVRPYSGEDQDCPHCRTQKSMVTTSIAHGVPGEEMKYVYGLRDATISPLTSGGLEYENVNTLLCGLPLATTSYSSGLDFTEHPFVYPLQWIRRGEAGTSFIKAANDEASIAAFMEHMLDMTETKKQEIAEKGRDWAMKTFSIEAVGPQWEAAFDALPPKDWSSITLTPAPKNPNYPMPQMPDPEQWVRALYNHILMVEPDPDGLKHWLAQLQAGIPREAIYRFFIGRAHEDNAKSAPPQDFGTLFDQTGRKKVLFVMKESGGDVFISTALFPGLKRLYPDSDLYVACEPKFADILAGNEHVHKVLPYHPAMESELHMMNYVDHYIFPAVQTQRQLGYLSRKCGLDLKPHRYDSSQKAVDAFTNDPR